MPQLTDDQFLQLVLVGGPILSLIGTWMSLKTYARLKADKKASVQKVAGENADVVPENPKKA